jgi:hypothetical protein
MNNAGNHYKNKKVNQDKVHEDPKPVKVNIAEKDEKGNYV